jgi:Flp pilus assembly CpaF family ATPase
MIFVGMRRAPEGRWLLLSVSSGHDAEIASLLSEE